jgi:hypothetical protein
MNSFSSRAGRQIYAMPGMETKLHAVINKRAPLTGFRRYSGHGFPATCASKFHGYTR